MNVQPLLLEIGTEELPPSSLAALGESLRDGIVAALAARQLQHGTAHWFATPRRLAVLVEALAEQAPARELEILGPPAERARDANGNWTPAAIGFANKQGVDPAALSIIATDKGDRLGIRRSEEGAQATAVISQILSEAVAQLPIAKRMRWGSSRAEFVRPVSWLLALYGDQSDFPASEDLFGLPLGRVSYGHRFHRPGAIRIESPARYVEQLRDAHVIADFDERQAVVRAQVEAVARSFEAIAVIDEDLLNEVTALVEWPVALSGSFDSAFLRVPAEALISSMKNHQKYFHVTDAQGQLLPRFITVANLESLDPERIVSGNERVIRPRLADAAFFYDTDRKQPLAARLQQLETVVFQQQLGTVADKARRVQTLAQALAPAVGADPQMAARAALLSKADLVSELVGEFAELQGIAGFYYASADGEAAEVARALRDQYLPRFSGDALPDEPVAIALALADRLDTLVGIFGIGQPPTGSKDPFALRRAALAVLRILVENELDLDLRALLQQTAAGFPAGMLKDTAETEVLAYVLERFRAWYEELAIPPAVFRAVIATAPTRPLDIQRRVLAVHAFARTEAASALAAANKRVANLLGKQEGGSGPAPLDPALLEAEAERELASALAAIQGPVQDALQANDYVGVLSQLATLRQAVDRFFDEVMVMTDDPAVRQNRLSLLAGLRAEFLRVADISELVVSH